MKFDVEYNARSLAPRDVAKSFIPPEPNFGKLFSKNSALIVGPRGSGKTTLLKMLTLRALQHWEHEDAPSYARQVSFNSAFIPADLAWGSQIRALDESSDELPSRCEAAFVLHCIRGLIRAMREAVELGRMSQIPDHVKHLAAELSKKDEASFAQVASESLAIEPILPTLLGVEIGVENSLNQAPGGDLERFSYEVLPSLISTLVTAFNGLIGDDTRRWALLIDELEIAPTRVKQFLLSGVRGFDERIILKLAMAPYMEDAQFGKDPKSPHPIHDYQTIPLTYSNKSDAAQFTRALVQRTFHRLGLEIDRVEDVFQRPPEGGFGGPRAATNKRDSLPKEFSELAKKDESFADFLRDKGILKPGYEFVEARVASDVRKTLPIVMARNFYLREFRRSEGIGSTRPRKSYGLYTGYPSIIEVTEGNPRAILTLITPLAQEQLIKAAKHEKLEAISAGSQAEAIRRVELLLTSLLQVIPLDLQGFDRDKGLLDFVDKIGEAFENRLIKGPFKADYVGTFRLDLDAPKDVVNAVGKALNAGALIHVPMTGGSSDSLLRGLQGQRFRISYALAPRHSLLLTLGDFVWLSNLTGRVELSEQGTAQSSFFDSEQSNGNSH